MDLPLQISHWVVVRVTVIQTVNVRGPWFASSVAERKRYQVVVASVIAGKTTAMMMVVLDHLQPPPHLKQHRFPTYSALHRLQVSCDNFP